MKKVCIIMFFAAFFVAVSLIAAILSDMEKDKAAIHEVIKTAYVEGVHINRDALAMEKGFHPQFNMLRLNDDNIELVPIQKWIDGINKMQQENPGPAKEKVTYKIPMIDITGNAAVARIELYKDSKHIFTDYMSLYKFSDGWKIVNKIFYRH